MAHFEAEIQLPPTYHAHYHGTVESNPWISKMPYRKLGNTELQVSLLSYGGSSLGKFYGDDITQESIETIREAIRCGVNYIDTSPWYGDSEKILGEALSCVPRQAYYIGTKVGRNYTPTWDKRFDFSRNAVLKNVENSLSLLGVDYLDIIQVHDAEFSLDVDKIVKETLPALESVVKAGKAKYIGITGYCLRTMKEIIEKSSVKIDTVLSYARMNFHDTTLLEYLPFFEAKNIGVINAAPVAMGLYTTKGPPAWHPGSDEVKKVAKLAAEFAQSNNVTIEQAAIGFGLRPKPKSIATTLVSMPNRDIMNTNLDAVTKPLSESDSRLYDSIFEVFRKNLTSPGHWEGKEIAEYESWRKSQ